MIDDFLVDVTRVATGGKLTQLSNRRMNFESDCMQLFGVSSRSPETYHYSIIAPKSIKLVKNSITIQLNPKTEKDDIMLRLSFRPEYEQYATLVVSKIQELNESNKERETRDLKTSCSLDVQSNNDEDQKLRQSTSISLEEQKPTQGPAQRTPLSPISVGDQNKPQETTMPDTHRSMSDCIEISRRLANTGNSCFFNATMQALVSCPLIVSRCTQLHRLFLGGHLAFHYDSDITKAKEKLLKGLIFMINLLIGYTNPENKREMLEEIRQRMGELEPSFGTNEQQDAHEYLSHLLNSINELMTAKQNIKLDINIGKEVVDVDSISSLNPASVFQFNTEQKLLCGTCKKENVVSASHQMMQIPMSNDAMKSVVLYDWLQSLYEASRVFRKCSECSDKIAYTTDRISDFPRCLIINLQRYGQDELNNFKIKKRVDVPFELDISSLGTFPPTVRDAKGCPKKFENEILETDKLKDLCQAPKLLGGDKEPDECQILLHERYQLHFKPLTDHREILTMLNEMDISCDEEAIKKHAEKLGKVPAVEMEKEDHPGKIVDIESDGNCFFRAISWCLTGVQSHHQKIRQATIKYLKENRNLFDKRYGVNDFDQYLTEKAEDGEWATSCEITALAMLLKVHIYTYLSSGWNRIGKNNERSGSIYLVNKTNSHYEPVTSLESHSPASRQQRILKRNAHDRDDKDDEDKHKNQKKIAKQSVSSINERTPEEPSIRSHLQRTCGDSNSTQNFNRGVYTLVAVVCHYGESTHKGHYVAYVKDMYGGCWFSSSDEIFEKVSEIRVADDICYNGYLLFYDHQ